MSITNTEFSALTDALTEGKDVACTSVDKVLVRFGAALGAYRKTAVGTRRLAGNWAWKDDVRPIPAFAGYAISHVLHCLGKHPEQAPMSNLRAHAEKLLSSIKSLPDAEETISKKIVEAYTKATSDSPAVYLDNLMRTTWASDMPATERLVLRTLAGFGPDPFPSRDTLASICGLSQKRVDKAIKELMDRKWLNVVSISVRGKERTWTAVNGKPRNEFRGDESFSVSGWSQSSNVYGLTLSSGQWWPETSRDALSRTPPPPPPKRARDDVSPDSEPSELPLASSAADVAF